VDLLAAVTALRIVVPKLLGVAIVALLVLAPETFNAQFLEYVDARAEHVERLVVDALQPAAPRSGD
jgi:hypothetical protein